MCERNEPPLKLSYTGIFNEIPLKNWARYPFVGGVLIQICVPNREYCQQKRKPKSAPHQRLNFYLCSLDHFFDSSHFQKVNKLKFGAKKGALYGHLGHWFKWDNFDLFSTKMVAWSWVDMDWISPFGWKSLLNGLHVKKSLLFGMYPHSSSYLGDATASIWGWMMEVK